MWGRGSYGHAPTQHVALPIRVRPIDTVWLNPMAMVCTATTCGWQQAVAAGQRSQLHNDAQARAAVDALLQPAMPRCPNQASAIAGFALSWCTARPPPKNCSLAVPPALSPLMGPCAWLLPCSAAAPF